MAEPEKPFACTIPDCGMTFTNEDHLHVHTRKHDMMLQFGPEQKAAFVADQTPTPTRFIRNCEEVGLFQDLQNVNPFDEGFKRAMETKNGILSLENAMGGSDDLHTPQMVYPLIDPGDSALFSTTNNQRNITISRSSSDESGAIKEFETTTISKLTNQVTTISRVVGKHEEIEDKDSIKKDSVSYTNNVIKIHSNVEIRKDNSDKPGQTIFEDTVIKDSTVTKDVLLTDTNKLQLPMPAMMSQKSIDFVVDSLTADFGKNDKKKEEDYEVIIKLPSGKRVRMKAVEELEITHENKTKEKLKKVIADKIEKKVPSRMVTNVIPIQTGTLIPVTLVNQTQLVTKVPILPLSKMQSKKTVKRKNIVNSDSKSVSEVQSDSDKVTNSVNDAKIQDLNSRSAASRRYRARLKETWSRQNEEIMHLKEANHKLAAEKAVLKKIITEHMKKCPNAEDLRTMQEKLKQADSGF